MQQTSTKPRGKAQNSTHMSRRPPRMNVNGAPDTPHQHPEQRADEDTITDWVSLEGGQVDPLAVPEQVKRDGWVVQWKVNSVLGSQDSMIKRRMTDYYRAGWRPVPGVRGAGYFFMPGEPVPPTIEIGGQLLMERPIHIEQHARKLNAQAARDQLQNKLEEIGMAAPANVRSKLVSVKVDENPEYMHSPVQAPGVPD